jgi:DNA-binding GntR family transcriptional regulator
VLDGQAVVKVRRSLIVNRKSYRMAGRFQMAKRTSQAALGAAPDGGPARVSKQERVYAILRARIVESEYLPGHRLVIDSVARELDVSPMPVREAIRRLEAEGWVVYKPNQGAHVAPLDETSWAEVMTTLAVLEGFATAAAAPHLGAADLARLRDVNGTMRRALADFDVVGFAEANRAFHAAIWRRCPNAHLRRQLELTLERLNTLRGTIFVYIPARARVSADEHERLVGMIESRDSAAAIERFAREHKLRTVRAYEQRGAGAAAR